MTTTLPPIQNIQVATVPLAAFLARQAAILAAAGTSTPLAEINFLNATVLVGDGNVSGSPQCPSISTLQSTNALMHQVWSGKIVQSASQNASNPNQIDLLCVIPAVDASGNEIGPFWVTEFIVTDEAGVPMIAGVTAAPKFTVANGAITDLSFIVSVAFAVGTVVLTAPSQPFMTQSQIQAALANIVSGVSPIVVAKSIDANGWTEFAVSVKDGAFVPIISATTFYVDAAHGSNFNNGLLSTTAFADIVYALSYISGFQCGGTVTIYVAPGNYAGATKYPDLIKKVKLVSTGGAAVTFINALSPAVNTDRGLQFFGSLVDVSGFTVSAYYECIVWNGGGAGGTATDCVVIGPGWTSTGIAYYAGAAATISGPSTLQGTFAQPFSIIQSAAVNFGYHDAANTYPAIITLSGTVNFNQFVNFDSGASCNVANGYVTFVNPSNGVGSKYLCTRGGGCTANGAGVNFFPGSTPGTVVSPGYYTP